MMTLHAISAGSGIDYLMSTVASGDKEIKARDLNAYWSSGGDTPGEWIGQKAAALGLTGQVSQEAADAIFKDGVDPATGKGLGRRWPRYPTADERYEQMLAREPHATEARKVELRKKADRLGEQTARAGWETVLSPVKSFSVLWGVSNDEVRAELEAAEAAAFAKVWARIEGEAAWTRVGPQGAAQVEADGGLIAAAFVHRSSRAGDPDWHRHVAISAKVQTADGRWLALDARPLHRITVALSEMYTTEVEREMYERFGIVAAPREDTIRPDKRPVREFAGVSADVVGLFSQRRRQTERALRGMLADFREREGREPSRPEQYALAQAAALTARPDKKPKSVGAERRQWRRRAWQAGVRMPGRWVQHAQRASREALADRPAPPSLDTVAGRTLAVLEQHRESWTRANAEAETYRQLTAAGWHLAAGDRFDALVQQVTDHVLSPETCELITPPEPLTVPSRYQRRDGSPIFVQHGSARYTSHRIKGWEADLVEAANRPAPVTRLTADQIDAALSVGDTARGFQPSEEQRAAVHEVFTGDTQARAIIGPAGTGKTTIMRLVKEVADAHGIEVLGLAGGQLQADNLAAAADIRAENLARWRTMSEQFARGQARWTLAPGTIVIVDEAGQASTPDLHAILRQVEDAGGRILPTGDPRQLGSPGVGGALALLEARSRPIYLSEVRRFRSVSGDLRQWEIDAAAALARGDAEGSWEAYSARGRIHTGTLDEMVDAAYAAWQADTADGVASILIAPTNALAAQLSDRARADRVAAGTVDDRNTVTLHDANRAGRGDQVVTRANNRDIHCEDTRQYVRNGDVWSVRKVLRGGALVVEHTLTGGVAELPAEYVAGGGVELGYAITKDRAQGVTVQSGHGLFAPGMDANSAYPALTRGSHTNHAYLSTDAGVDLETGEPGRPLTGRQAWAAIVARDGTQLSATALQARMWDEADAIRTHIPRLRYVLDQIADAASQQAIRRLLGEHLGNLITTAPAWPALRAQLMEYADAGYDTDALVVAACATREWTGDIDDYAAILHARNRTMMEAGHAERLRFRDEDGEDQEHERPATATTYETDPEATGADVLRAIGLTLPEDQAGDDGQHEYADQLADAIRARADHLAELARADAQASHGWAAAYGPEPEPESVAGAVAWRDQLAAAAAFRDLADYTGADPTGPAPTDDQPMVRGLWRAAQMLPDDQAAYINALALAASGATWLDAVGTPPAPGDPARPAWARAVAAVADYRGLWEFGHETAAIGDRPTEPVQAADYDAARRALDAYRWVKAHPALAELDGDTLAVIIAQGNAGETAAEAAAAAIAAYDAATVAQTAAEQAAEDAENRAATARTARETLVPQVAAELPGTKEALEEMVNERIAELETAAARARAQAENAEQTTDATRARVEETAPGALAAREAMRKAEEARRILARRAMDTSSDPEAPPADEPPRWDERPHGDLTERELVDASAHAVAEAVEIERAAPAPVYGPQTQETAQATAAAAELREHAGKLRAEYRTRAVMTPEQRTQETEERTARRTRTAAARLAGAYADTTGPEALDAARGRARTPQQQPEPCATDARRKAPEAAPKPAPGRPQQRPADERRPAPRNQTEERLDRAYGDATGPEAMDKARGRKQSAPKPTPADRPAPSPQQPEKPAPATQPQAEKPTTKPKRRRASERLDQAYDRDGGAKPGSRPDDAAKRRNRPKPPRPGGPSI
ncbi:MobF family relaxase [Streptomyces sp. CA2R106]|uniref:MobF family relaxase n=1 Tax=Streptomyces sp. CA2R106 TaxID=3120153 RepID=UPI003008B610